MVRSSPFTNSRRWSFGIRQRSSAVRRRREVVMRPLTTIPQSHESARSVFLLQDRHEGLLRDVDAAHALHALLAFLLLLEQLPLAAHVAAVALGGHVLAHA